jgi:hypothetical protein
MSPVLDERDRIRGDGPITGSALTMAVLAGEVLRNALTQLHTDLKSELSVTKAKCRQREAAAPVAPATGRLVELRGADAG